MCDVMQGIGGCGGGLAEYISVDEDLVYALPEGIPCKYLFIIRFCVSLTMIAVDIGALMEPLAVAWHAVKRSNMKPGDKVLILGAGPVSRTRVAEGG